MATSLFCQHMHWPLLPPLRRKMYSAITGPDLSDWSGQATTLHLPVTSMAVLVQTCFFPCWDIVVTETFRSFVLQLYQNFPKQCSYAYVFRCSDQNDLIFLVISKTFQSMTEKKGLDYTSWSGALGVHEMDNLNQNGQRPIELCSTCHLCLVNTCFAVSTNSKVTKMHPPSWWWHQLDHMIARRRMNKVSHCCCCSIHSADGNTDYVLVCC